MTLFYTSSLSDKPAIGKHYNKRFPDVDWTDGPKLHEANVDLCRTIVRKLDTLEAEGEKNREKNSQPPRERCGMKLKQFLTFKTTFSFLFFQEGHRPGVPAGGARNHDGEAIPQGGRG